MPAPGTIQFLHSGWARHLSEQLSSHLPPSCGRKTELNPVGHTGLVSRNRVPCSATLTSASRLRAAETDMSVMARSIGEERDDVHRATWCASRCSESRPADSTRLRRLTPAVASELRDQSPGTTTIRTRPCRPRRAQVPCPPRSTPLPCRIRAPPLTTSAPYS